MSYLKGIYYAVLGRVDVDSYDCMPVESEVNLTEFSERISSEYSEVLSVLAE